MAILPVKRLAVPLLAFVVGGALLAFSVPRTIAAFVTLPSGPILRKLQNLEPVAAEDLEILIASQERGLSWVDAGRTWTDLGLAQILLANEFDQDDPNRQRWLDAAINSLKTGLGKAPANPFAWTRLAYAQAMKDGVTAKVLPTFRLGLETAPFEPRLALPRLTLGFAAWPILQPADREMVLRQVRHAWRNRPQDLVAFAVRSGTTNLIRAALLRRPKDLAAFERRLKRTTK